MKTKTHQDNKNSITFPRQQCPSSPPGDSQEQTFQTRRRTAVQHSLVVGHKAQEHRNSTIWDEPTACDEQKELILGIEGVGPY